MRRSTILTISLLVCCFNLFLSRSSLADVAPGDLIDKTNWQKVQGLVPESVAAWVRDGKMVLQIDDLDYEPRDYHPVFYLEAEEKNLGKYVLADDHWIVEAERGRRTEYIVGVPFPGIDPEDPKTGEMIMYNKKYIEYAMGDFRAGGPLFFIGPSDFERSLDVVFINTALDGNPKYAERPNPDGLLNQQIALVRRPYDMAGVAVMTWRFRDPGKQDAVFGYVPAIRRVRRSSPANRSDALFGSDMASDDAGLYNGKLAAMEWRLLRKLDALLPFSYKDPGIIELNKQGEWETVVEGKALRYGYEKEGWEGAPWAPVDWVWVKRPTYVIEMKPRDRYYNYGIQHLWIGAEVPSPAYKIIYDKSGSYWKTTFKSRMASKSADGSMYLTIMGDQIAVDDRSGHATIAKGVGPKNLFTYFANIDTSLFSLAGFQKFCK